MKTAALLGNPNCGKTTLFNALTGSTAHVGNWPGVTVDKKTGTYKKLKEEIEIVDLPGIYSLSPYTPEEVISRNFILDENPDVVINIIDATNLERNLYLTTQLLEINVPVVIALNMTDIIKKNGDKIDAKILEQKLGVPVVEISALRGDGIDELMRITLEESYRTREGKTLFEDKQLLHLITDVKIAFEGKGVNNPLFHSVKLVENDEIEVKDHSDLLTIVSKYKEIINDEIFGDDFEALIADARYKYIEKEFGNVVSVSAKSSNGETKSSRIDKVLTHRIWGLPIFIAIMFLIFHFTFSEDLFFMGKMGLSIENEGWVNFFTGMGYEGEALEGIPSIGVFLQSWMGWLTGQFIAGFQWICSGFQEFGDVAANAASSTWYGSLICDGVLTGLDAVCSFIPQIMLLFLFIAIMEDTGYMARIAFILDRAFRKFGLSGKAFIPMLTGFGCSVPAIMATRTIENDVEKNRTIRLMTCFSCGAKAPIWALLAAVAVACGFGYADIFVFSIYIGGIALAVILAILMRVFSKDKYVSPFIMELPQYHLPQPKNVGAHLWEKLKHYVYKAATILTASLIVIWFLNTFGFENGSFCMVEEIEHSLIGYIGMGLKYLFYPCGWAINSDGWKFAAASVTGLVAKEDVVGTMAILFNGGAEDTLAESITSLSAAGIYSFAIFNLLTFPCMAAIATAKSEQTKKEFLKTLGFWFGVSYGMSSLVYWVGTLYEVSIVGGILVTLAIIGLVVFASFLVMKKDKFTFKTKSSS
ncbi:MAG: ferrous iron transporter B [Bacilli bacterium]|nr:ferrous iron transporter B [Bacilli bacterium]